MPGARVLGAEVNERVNEVAKAILEGYSNRRILMQYLAEKFNSWGKCERQIDYYISKAKELLNDISENDIKFEKSLALNRLDALYTLNYKIHDFRECRNIVETRAKILGYNAPTEITINTDDLKPKEEFLSKIQRVKKDE